MAGRDRSVKPALLKFNPQLRMAGAECCFVNELDGNAIVGALHK